MSTDTLLARLENVRRTGPGKWIARCPAHDDGRPSLSIKEAEDGKTLVWCFAGCTAEEVANAAGIELKELFPPSGLNAEYARAVRQSFNAYDVLQVARFEMLLVCIMAGDIAAGREPKEEDLQRALLAYQRLERAANATERR